MYFYIQGEAATLDSGTVADVDFFWRDNRDWLTILTSDKC